MRLTRFQWLLAATVVLAAAVFCLSAGTARWVLWGVLFSAAGLAAGLGASFPEWGMFGSSLCRVRTARKVVALTFDDGPDPAGTPALLDLLSLHNAHATFFRSANASGRFRPFREKWRSEATRWGTIRIRIRG